MRDAILYSAARTPIGKFSGALSSLPAPELGGIVVDAVVKRAGIPTSAVDEVIMGNVLSAGLGQAPARQAALKGGLPGTVAALTVNKVCGSGLKAAMLAAQAIRCGDAELIIAGGMESMSRAGYVLPRKPPALGDQTLFDTLQYDGLTCAFSGRRMGDIADSVASQFGITRDAQDRFALESHRRACVARDSGAFDTEIVPVKIGRPGKEQIVDRDEGPRAESTLEQLGSLRAVFRGDGTVTAGNASMISDGAAAVLVGSAEAGARYGLTPLARIVASATSGGEPEDLFTAPIAAVRQVVDRAGLKLSDIDLFEINEAFASQVLACLQQLELDTTKVNIHGGAIALGHPVGASGARVLVTLLNSLRAQGQHYGVATLCLGGGNAVAMLVERV